MNRLRGRDAANRADRPTRHPAPAAGSAAPAGRELEFAIGETSLGLVLVAWTAIGLRAVLMGDDETALTTDLRRRFPGTGIERSPKGLAGTAGDVLRLVEAPAHLIDSPLDLAGTPFQQAVWHALREIPVGRTASYTEIAIRIDRPRSVRAVAQACAANHLAVVVPCHRVVRGDGGLSGYRWGVERKRRLLEMEGVR